MAWKNTNFERYGVVKIEGDKVIVYKDQFNYTTIPVGKPVTSAKWVEGDLIITMTDGTVRCYEEQNFYKSI